MNPVHGETTDKLFFAFTLQTSLTASLKQNESSSPVSKSCSTRSEKGKASIVAARSLCVETPLTKLLILILVYTLQTSSAVSLTPLEMKESSSPVNKRSSTGSVKGKVSSCYEDWYFSLLCGDWRTMDKTASLFSSFVYTREAQLFP